MCSPSRALSKARGRNQGNNSTEARAVKSKLNSTGHNHRKQPLMLKDEGLPEGAQVFAESWVTFVGVGSDAIPGTFMDSRVT